MSDIDTIRFIFERSCLKKSNLSLETANNIVDLHAREGRLLYYYKCNFCSSYHLSKKSPSEVQLGQKDLNNEYILR